MVDLLSPSLTIINIVLFDLFACGSNTGKYCSFLCDNSQVTGLISHSQLLLCTPFFCCCCNIFIIVFSILLFFLTILFSCLTFFCCSINISFFDLSQILLRDVLRHVQTQFWCFKFHQVTDFMLQSNSQPCLLEIFVYEIQNMLEYQIQNMIIY